MRGEGKELRMGSHSSRRGGVEARVNALKQYSIEGGEVGKLEALVLITKPQAFKGLGAFLIQDWAGSH